MLGSRLLDQRSADFEHEKVVVRLLRQNYGSSYTCKLEGMLNDYIPSKVDGSGVEALEEDLVPFCRSKGISIDFSVMVLNESFWPSLNKRLDDARLAGPFLKCMDVSMNDYCLTIVFKL